MRDGSTEKPDYPRTAEQLFTFCVEGLTDPNAMIRRLNHAERDANISKDIAAEVREALWERAHTTFHQGAVGRPPMTFRGVVPWIGRRRGVDG